MAQTPSSTSPQDSNGKLPQTSGEHLRTSSARSESQQNPKNRSSADGQANPATRQHSRDNSAHRSAQRDNIGRDNGGKNSLGRSGHGDSARHEHTNQQNKNQRQNSPSSNRPQRGRQHRNRPQPPKPLSPERLEQRRAAVPRISYPEQLPVSARREEIAAAIRDNQVVIVAGETGSGKTTQLPKICLELGRGISGFIGHTQPRRIAARSVAERICYELGVNLGGVIGYQVRFTEEVGPNTLVKLMTDGILLAEIQSDPDLLRYDTLIIDEAHERSLNIDFILGYLAQLLPRRPELKVIVTSATIDTERFAAHFGEHSAGGKPGDIAPIIEVSGPHVPGRDPLRPAVR